MLTDAMKRLITEQPLGYVATAAPDGMPNVSPKGTFFVVDDTTIAFAEIRSPATLANLRSNPRIAVNFVDPFVRKGFRVSGSARILARGEPGFDDLLARSGSTLTPRVRAIVLVDIAEALPLSSPSYDDGATEAELRRAWTTRFRKAQPDETFRE